MTEIVPCDRRSHGAHLATPKGLFTEWVTLVVSETTTAFARTWMSRPMRWNASAKKILGPALWPPVLQAAAETLEASSIAASLQMQAESHSPASKDDSAKTSNLSDF